MIILSNICIIALSIIFLFIISVKVVFAVVETKKINPDTAATLTIALFILSIGALLPRLYIWLF